ncbi:hypothetical protein YC2023_107889 [Brassica napus]
MKLCDSKNQAIVSFFLIDNAMATTIDDACSNSSHCLCKKFWVCIIFLLLTMQ